MTDVQASAVQVDVLRDLGLLTPDDVCTLLKVKKSWLYDEVERGALEAIRPGRQLRFRPSVLTRYVDSSSRAAVVVPDAEVRSGMIRRHLKSIVSRWRKLNPGQQAPLVLAYLRRGETFEQLAAGFGVGRTTASRYVNETVELLAARAPKLRRAVRDAERAGHANVILDGTLIPIDLVAADRPSTRESTKSTG